MKRMLLSVLVISLTMSVQAALGERIAILGIGRITGQHTIDDNILAQHRVKIPGRRVLEDE